MVRLLFRGEVKGGRLTLCRPDRFGSLLQRLDGARVILTLELEQEAKSPNLEAYLWGVVYAEAARKTGHTVNEIHADMKERFGWATTGLMDRVAYSGFVSQVVAFLASELGIEVPESTEAEPVGQPRVHYAAGGRP